MAVFKVGVLVKEFFDGRLRGHCLGEGMVSIFDALRRSDPAYMVVQLEDVAD
jgi:hypothetical protein